ncbi:multidrug ABC transporter ATP-binding protein [Listeria monocytogenes]|uniref:Putative drug efflux/lipid export ABC transporter, ATP-binding and permease protein n=1 Tax=Listeria monocytogenes serotype 4a (strain M7) TaxID=1030009 RepID=A0A0E0UUK8_LISMM|nr:ABC transporter ATP-binding protein [Listeria monocytogenes]ACK40361.1 ABC transporter, ATP-binding/permease protein [Listeria monocytogenes HCC23]AEH91645.1 putative drug efflux/lipid export ABC transporter, ATP-binding and permease protein [Listeria monocytogenes M7]AKS53224.1 multidrug ABC transporter ATP-binding protein [Listeria monocytogenes]EAC3108966.1 ABC transporter ATP-binding protein [Listeria monocytogenes]EAC3451585.1 ABC transporter ATP-binding protein [Listeria monocytogenes
MMKLMKRLKPYWLSITAVLVLTFGQVIGQLYLPTLMSNIIDKGVVTGDTNYIWSTGMQMLLISFASVILSVIVVYLASRISMGFGKDLRDKIFTKVEDFSLQEFDKVGTSSLITRTTNDVVQIQNVLYMMMRLMVMAPIMLLGGIIMAVGRDAKLSLIFVVVLPLLLLLVVILGGKAMPMFKSLQKKMDKLNRVIREGLTGIRVVRSFNRNEDELEKFEEANADYATTAIKVNRLLSLMSPLMMLLMNLTSIAIVWIGSIFIGNGDMQVGDLMAFIQYAMQIMMSFMMLSAVFIMIPRAGASAERINEVLDMNAEILNPENPKTSTPPAKLSFENVTFRYEGAEKPVIEDITFEANAGETVAIIGSTGAGKSTLINMIPRFYDVESGVVKINGIDVREMDQSSLRQKIGLVPQKAVLFTGTIASNMRYGKEDATDEEIWAALRTAQAENFVSKLANGLGSRVEQGGNNFSGGQKQRLSIARSLIRKPEIYIFDDSFSALDFKTDAKLREALKAETTEAVTLIVAQRITSVVNSDQIIVMNEGKIAGIGTHEELKESNQIYQEIMRSQLSEEEIA